MESALQRLLAPHAAMSAELRAWHGLSTLTGDDPADAARSLVRHRRGLHDALAACEALRAAGVPHVVLKGPVLQEMLYGDAGTRPYSDIDLLVEPANVPAALRALHDAGWSAPASIPRGHFHATCPSQRDDHFPVELHARWVDRANLHRTPDGAGIADALPLRVPGGTLPTLGPDDVLLYLCLHAAKHGFVNETALAMERDAAWFLLPGSGNRLLWFLDIALLIENTRPALDLRAVTERIRAWNLTAPVAASLAVTARLLPASAASDLARSLGLGAWTPRASNRWMRSLVARAPARGLRTDLARAWRPARLAELPDLLFPGADELAGFLGHTPGIVDHITHPLRMIARLIRRSGEGLAARPRHR